MSYCNYCGDHTGGYVPVCNACIDDVTRRPANKVYSKCVNCGGSVTGITSEYQPDAELCSLGCGFNLAIRIMREVPGAIDLLIPTCGDNPRGEGGRCLLVLGHNGIHRNSFYGWGK